MKIRSDLIAIFLSTFVFLANLSGTMQDLGLMEEIPLEESVEKQTFVTNTSSSGGSRRVGNEVYVPDSISVLEDVYSQNYTITTPRVIGSANLFGVQDCRDALDYDHDACEKYLPLYRFYQTLLIKDVQISGVNQLDIVKLSHTINYETEYMTLGISKNVLSIYQQHNNKQEQAARSAPDDLKVTVTGTVYHPKYDYLSDNFTLNFYKTVTGDVYGN